MVALWRYLETGEAPAQAEVVSGKATSKKEAALA
jgi:hypothetical protein